MKKAEGERGHLKNALAGKGAHVDFEEAIKNFPVDLRGKHARGVPHTAWQVLEHIRITQADILNFCINPDYKDLNWPQDYWPSNAAPDSEAAWDRSIAGYRGDLKKMQELIGDSARDLHSQIPHGDGQTLFREAILVIDHSSYHVGQLVTLRQLLGIWPPK
jgi:uncharacterized damage-inducible protein DinB